MINFFFFLISLNFSFLIFFKNFSKVISLYDKPDGIRKLHKKRISNIGGFIFFVNLSVIFLYLNFFYFEDVQFFLNNKQFNILYFFSLIFFLIGYLDDKINLNPNLKLVLFLFLIYFFLLFFPSLMIENLNFSFYKHSINIFYISNFFTILAFLLFINAFNMFDGINLQSGIYSVFILVIFFIKSNFNFSFIFLILPLIFFLILNYQNKCFLGNNGSLLLSFIFSVLFIDFHNNKKLLFADEIFLIMLVPGLDLLRLFVNRILQRRNPFSADRNHIHHLLLKKYNNFFSLNILFSLILLPYIMYYFFNIKILSIIFSIFLYFFLIKLINK